MYLLLDPCRALGLSERINGKAECLLRGQSAEGLENTFPWLIAVDETSPLLHDFLSDDPPKGIWAEDPGLIIKSDLEFSPLLRHLRKFHRCRVDATEKFLLLRYWEPELLVRLFEMNFGHIQGLITPQIEIIARYGHEACLLTSDAVSEQRPGNMTGGEAHQISLLLLQRRRMAIARRVKETFPNHVAHLSDRALEREVHIAWETANTYKLRDGAIRAKFIVLAVALAPGFHLDDTVADTFSRSKDPDQTFLDLDCIIRKTVGAAAREEVA